MLCPVLTNGQVQTHWKKAAPHTCASIATLLSGNGSAPVGSGSCPPTPSVRALIPAAALPQVSQLRAWHHLRAHLSHASLLREFRQHLMISLVAPFLTRCSQRMSRIKLSLCQAQCEITSSG